MARWVWLLVLGLSSGCAATTEEAGSTETASSGLSLSPKGGLAFLQLDGFMATGDATSSGYANLWTGNAPPSRFPVAAIVGPRITGFPGPWGSFLSRDWTGAAYSLTGHVVSPTGAVTSYPNLPLQADATHMVAIPDAPVPMGQLHPVFFYSATSHSGSIRSYSYSPSAIPGMANFTSWAHPAHQWTGFGNWDQIVSYPRGVLFFQAAGEVVWRGRFRSDGFTFEFAPLPSPPHPNPVKPSYTHVTYVAGSCGTQQTNYFYDRNSGVGLAVRYDPDTDTIASVEPERTLGAGYDKIVGTGNGQVFLYKDSGQGLLVDVCTGAHVVQTGFSPNWQAITRVE